MPKLDTKTFAEALLSVGFEVDDVVHFSGASRASVYRWINDFKENPNSIYNLFKKDETEIDKERIKEHFDDLFADCIEKRAWVRDRENLLYLYRANRYLNSRVEFGDLVFVMRRFYEYAKAHGYAGMDGYLIKNVIGFFLIDIFNNMALKGKEKRPFDE